jgi:hypothetical protein
MKIMKPQEFNLPAFTNKERDHIRKRSTEILKRGNTCAPSVWTKKRFKKTV